jgi:hypothetical protein
LALQDEERRRRAGLEFAQFARCDDFRRFSLRRRRDQSRARGTIVLNRVARFGLEPLDQRDFL